MVICNILLNCWMSTIPWALVRTRPLQTVAEHGREEASDLLFARVCIASLVRVHKTILLVFVNGYPISGRYDGRIDDLYSHGFR